MTNHSSNRCCLCGEAAVVVLADFGPQPVCSHFLKDPADSSVAHPLVLGQCAACGLVQLVNPIAPEHLVPPYDWIVYNEPEGHLDALADQLAALPGMSARHVIVGVSYKDDSLIRRLRERGFSYTWRIDPARDLELDRVVTGLEITQGRLDPERMTALTHRRGRSDLVIARQILEHSHDMPTFLEGLRRLLYPGGCIMLEVPDCSLALDHGDAAILWEEHLAYFTPATFRYNLESLGFDVVFFQIYPYAFENALVAVVRPGPKPSARPNATHLADELERGRRFVKLLAEQREAVQRLVRTHKDRGEKVAMFGAGHLACLYINVHGLGDLLDFVVDDHPKKQGLFLPGSKLPIRPSAALLSENVRLCLLGLSPESEAAVIAKQRAFVERGGRFVSVHPTSQCAETLKL